MESLKIIIEKQQPDIIALCETKLGKNSLGLIEETLNKKQYKLIPRFTKAGKEGLTLAVKHNTFQTTLDVTHTQLNTILAVRLSTGTSNIRVILGYAPQETDDEVIREQFFDELALEIKVYSDAGDVPVLLGDFNAKLEPSNTPQGNPTSRNGSLFHEVLKEHDLVVLNFNQEICTGKWTHVKRTTGASSVLDYVATTTNFQKNVKEMLIDESTILCPFRVVQREGTRSNTFSDHNSIFLNFEVPRFKQTHQEYNAHCLVKPDGYSTMSTIFNEECDKMSTDQESQELYNEFERLIDETLDQSFLKTKKQRSRSSFDSKIDHKFKSLCKKLTQFASRGKVQRTVAAQYRTRIEQANTELVAVRNRDKLQQRVANLTENDKFSAQKFWKTKKSIMGSQASCNSVFNQNGREVFDTDDIIEAYRSEFDNRLSSVEIKATLTEYKARMETLCNEIIKTTSAVKVPDFTQEELNTVVSKLKHGIIIII